MNSDLLHYGVLTGGFRHPTYSNMESLILSHTPCSFFYALIFFSSLLLKELFNIPQAPGALKVQPEVPSQNQTRIHKFHNRTRQRPKGETMKSIEPGHYPDQKMTEYHSSDGLSKTGLVKILDCPARFYAEYLDNERPASKEASPSLVLGSLTHNLVLEPERFAYEFTLAPQINRRTKAGKAEYEQWKKDNAGKTVISPEQHRQAQAMTNALAGHPIASRLLTGGQAAQSFYAIDPDYGLLVKARPDYMVEVNGQVIPVDLKTAHPGR